jgi:ubiquinone/menaquinone biosynthesis C-methylase UbiE
MKKFDSADSVYVLGDCTDLEYEDDTFDFAIDKATTDAMMCASDAPQGLLQMYAEMVRVLKPGAHFVMITYGAPENRTIYLDHPQLQWRVVATLPLLSTKKSQHEPDTYDYVYVMQVNHDKRHSKFVNADEQRKRQAHAQS